MPELPDVEVKRKYIESTSMGKAIASVKAPSSRVLKNVTPTSLNSKLKGQELVGTKRRAKFILIQTSGGGTLLMHFGMTGDVSFRAEGEDAPKYCKARFVFSDGSSLFYTDPRMFGRIALYSTQDDSRIPDIAGLGPEPLDRSFTFKKFDSILRSHNTTVHQVLMDQSLIAGIGNIFSDEIAYQASVLSYRKTSDLTDGERRILYDKMKWTLRKAIDLDADLDRRADLFLIPHRGKGGTCPHGHPLESRTIGGRTSWFCPVEQR